MKKGIVFLLALAVCVVVGYAAFAEEIDLPPEQELEEAYLWQTEMERIAQKIGLVICLCGGNNDHKHGEQQRLRCAAVLQQR